MEKSWDYMIIGSGIAGFKAAESIRKHDQKGRILLINNEDRHPYKRTRISKSIASGFAPDDFALTNSDWYNQMEIQLVQDMALSFDKDKKVVHLKRLGRFSFQKLILCLGASSIVPVLKGNARNEIYTLRKAADAEQLSRHFLSGGKVVVSGGGVEGVEISEQAVKSGCQVTLVHNNAYLLNKQFDRSFAELIQNLLTKHGIQLILNENIRSIGSTGNVKKIVQIGDLIHILAEHIIVSHGTKPNIELAIAAGLKTNRGILVNQFMETSCRGIYAAGDVAEHPGGQLTGLWHAAEKQGVVAGTNAAGHELSYPENPFRMKLELFGQYFFSLNKPAEEHGYEVTTYKKGIDQLFRCYFKNGRLSGMLMANDPSQAKVCEKAVYEQWSQTDVLNKLITITS